MEKVRADIFRAYTAGSSNPLLFSPLSIHPMDFLPFFLFILSPSLALVSGVTFTEFVYPNFTATNLRFVDSAGSFLLSSNGTFEAAMFNPGGQQRRFYLCVIHAKSNTVIWSANRDSPLSESGAMSLTSKGIGIYAEGGGLRWSTPPFRSPVFALHLKETGNLVLLDRSNATIWQSFDHPTDTIVIGQQLHIGTVLTSAISRDDLSTGIYRLVLTASDAILQWERLTYWKLSMDTKAYVDSNYAVEYMAINQTGLFLLGQNGSAVVIQVNLPVSDFRVARMHQTGQFIVSSFSGVTKKQDFVVPVDECRIPLICGKIGLCTNGVSVVTPVCSCPVGFRATSSDATGCVPADSSYSLPVACNSTHNSSYLSYLRLGNAVDYFANDYTLPVHYGVNISECQDLCSQDCTCLGIFYENSSGSCYKLEKLGSVMLRPVSKGRQGFVKVVVGTPPTNFDGFMDHSLGFPPVAVVLLPLSGVIFIFVIGILLWRRHNLANVRKPKACYSNSPSSGELEISIPGLPLRYKYEELQEATENFKTKIGTGGFGTVYKGTLPDKTPVAVKRISNLGVRGKKDFCTEIAVIGNIHHVNLVKLKGYCAQKRQWLLVYEYMNRGSLDKTLFGNGPVLEWRERVEIAVGAARGLTYLHAGCEQKIIHCDVKPENILLDEHFQARISDFGLSKLLSRDQSSLFTTMRGTRGYLAPEWLTSSAVSDKTDVYSFGMVLFEIVSGRKNCSPQVHRTSLDENSSLGGSSSSSVQGLVYFPLYALEMHEQGRYLELVDPRLQGRATGEEVEKLVRVALCCVHEEPALRPTMISIVGMLEGEIPPGNPRIESLNFLRFYGRRFAEDSTTNQASMAEESAGGPDEFVMYPGASSTHSSTTSQASNAGFSYMSSQQMSGPR